MMECGLLNFWVDNKEGADDKSGKSINANVDSEHLGDEEIKRKRFMNIRRFIVELIEIKMWLGYPTSSHHHG
jgi:hypothetical protein